MTSVVMIVLDAAVTRLHGHTHKGDARQTHGQGSDGDLHRRGGAGARPKARGGGASSLSVPSLYNGGHVGVVCLCATCRDG